MRDVNTEIRDMLEEAQEHVEEACALLRKVERAAKRASLDRLADTIHGYTLGNISLFLDDSEYLGGEYQMGKFSDLIAMVDGDEEDEEP